MLLFVKVEDSLIPPEVSSSRHWLALIMSPTLHLLAGLYLPTSDIDLVVMDSKCGDVPIALKALASSLLRRSMAKGIQVTACVPLSYLTHVIFIFSHPPPFSLPTQNCSTMRHKPTYPVSVWTRCVKICDSVLCQDM